MHLKSASDAGATIEIIAFHLGQQQFCLETVAIREIRGWAPSTPLPHAPADVLGVMNLRGSVIPIIDIAAKLGMHPTEPSERSAVVVAEVHGKVVGLVVERVSDILTIDRDAVQPIPEVAEAGHGRYAKGVVATQNGMVCFLDLAAMFAELGSAAAA